MSFDDKKGFLPSWMRQRNDSEETTTKAFVQSKIQPFSGSITEKGPTSSYRSDLAQMIMAISKEIASVKLLGSAKIYITDGIHMGNQNGYSIYVFTMDREIHLPSDVKVTVEYQTKSISGILLSTDTFTLVLALNAYINTKISFATLTLDPWYVLDAMRSTLSRLILDSEKSSCIEKFLTPRDLLSSYQPEHPVENLHLQQANRSQEDAIKHSLQHNVSFIWGPPGTGKSTTLGLTASNLIDSGESLLILAHSNVAVDVAMLSVIKHLRSPLLFLSKGSIIRLGIPQHPDLRENDAISIRGIVREQFADFIHEIELKEQKRRKLLKISQDPDLNPLQRHQISRELKLITSELRSAQSTLKNYEKDLVTAATVIGCTFSKLTLDLDLQNRSFDNILIDEASMAYIPHCVIAAALARKRIIVYGDFRQLPPIAQSEDPLVKKWLFRDIYQYLGLTDIESHQGFDPRLKLLDTQYRMHPAIADVPNTLFYQHLLNTASEIITNSDEIAQKSPFSGHALVTFDISNLNAHCIKDSNSNSRFNLVTAIQSISLLDQAMQNGLTVGIATPYNAQARLIRKMLYELQYDPEAVASTIHQFQGSERDVIIFDTVESPNLKPSRLFLDNTDTPNRLANVVISRAKGKFIFVGDANHLQSVLPKTNGLNRLTKMVQSKGSSVKPSWSRESETIFASMDHEVRQYAAKKEIQDQLAEDLNRADEEIVISWPKSEHTLHVRDRWLRGLKTRVKFYISGSGAKQFFVELKNAHIWENRSKTPYGLIGIDKHVLWVFLSPEHKNCAVLRIQMPQTIRLLYAFLGLLPEDIQSLDAVQYLQDKNHQLTTLACPQCRHTLRFTESQRGHSTLYCSNTKCGYVKRLTPYYAAKLARESGLSTCEKCGAEIQGRSGPFSIFVGCSNYPKCDWTHSLSEILLKHDV